MFSIIESYADKSETIKEARKNVKENAFFKGTGTFHHIILYIVACNINSSIYVL